MPERDVVAFEGFDNLYLLFAEQADVKHLTDNGIDGYSRKIFRRIAEHDFDTIVPTVLTN